MRGRILEARSQLQTKSIVLQNSPALICPSWTPSRVNPAFKDDRTLGLSLNKLTMRAKGAGRRVFQANTGEWKQPQRLRVGFFQPSPFPSCGCA